MFRVSYCRLQPRWRANLNLYEGWLGRDNHTLAGDCHALRSLPTAEFALPQIKIFDYDQRCCRRIRVPFGMPMYDIAIVVDAAAVSFQEDHETIEVARERTLMAAVVMMLKRVSQATPSVADCAIKEIGGDEERTFAVCLAIDDYI